MKALLLALVFSQEPATAFVGVNVVVMDSARVLRDQTVLVEGGRITAVGPRAGVRVPAAARRVEGRGRYLMPGLADMHAHPDVAGDFALYLAHGVTTVAHMGGSLVRVAAWRDSITAGRLDGPHLYASVFLNNVPGGAEGARAAVARADSQGADFVKVYNNLTAEQFAAVVAEARRRRLPVVGHAVRALGLERGFSSGQVAVVHAEEFIYSDFQQRNDTTLIPAAVEYTRRTGAWVIPNLSAYNVIARQWGRPAVIDTLLATPDAAELPQYWQVRWRRSRYVGREGSIDAWVPFLTVLTRSLHRGGVPLLAGTDSPDIPGMQAGASLHQELRLLRAAGLSTFEALAAATRNAGAFVQAHFRNAEAFGTVAPGNRADLLLLERNPLEDLANAERPAGVMARGRWYSREALAEGVRRARQAGRTAATEVERVLVTRGESAAAAHHRMLRRDSAAVLVFSEDEMNSLGYALLAAGNAGGARLIFRLNVEDYPRSANVYDSYADALLALGDSAGAAAAYERVLAVLREDPGQPNAAALEANARRFLAARR